MRYDYDLVILGQRPAAISAAEQAVVWGAHVAVIASPECSPVPEHLQFSGQFSGVDVVHGRYEFEAILPSGRRRQPLRLRAIDPQQPNRPRQFRSRAYLLVPDARIVAPSWPRLAQIPHVAIATDGDADRILQELETQRDISPRSALIYGGRSPRSLELALALLESGIETRILTRNAELFPIGSDASHLQHMWKLSALSSGLACEYSFDDRNVRGVEHCNGQVHLHTTTETYTADRLFLTDRAVPDFDTTAVASLQASGVVFKGEHLWVDRYLCSSHPQMFACAAALPGHDMEAIATHEALTATRNALLPRWWRRMPNYAAISWGISGGVHGNPGFARVGWTQAQAQVQGHRAIALDLTVKDRRSGIRPRHASQVAAQVVLSETGQILGATIVADRAADLIVPFGLAIAQGTSIDTWRTWAGMTSGTSDLLRELCDLWRDRWWSEHRNWYERAQLWFDDRRS